ncbi:hypothetical protein B9Z51_06660 [Limnohabitans sp. T6-5]|nr:hypothetical protein B9Z51_06660 [Limnohabitans sp. T6-5]
MWHLARQGLALKSVLARRLNVVFRLLAMISRGLERAFDLAYRLPWAPIVFAEKGNCALDCNHAWSCHSSCLAL